MRPHAPPAAPLAAPPAAPQAPPLLQVDDLWLGYRTRAGTLPAVRRVSFTLGPGESLGLVGESGCGKSTLAYAVMHYLGRTGVRMRGHVRYRGEELATLPPARLRALRGDELAMVDQDPTAALNPVLTVGEQLMEVARAHHGAGAAAARARALALLDEVRLADPAALLRRYPHQLSGGQQQRVAIAMALMGEPRLLVMDEPTTGLDVTIEAGILALVNELRRRRSMALLFISHNLGTVVQVAERLGVMYGGELVEQGPLRAVLRAPAHPYTRGLLDCLPAATGAGGHPRRATLRPIPGQVPAVPEDRPGCTFAPRCAHAEPPRCTTGTLAAEPVPGPACHAVRCVRHAELPPWQRGSATDAAAPVPDPAGPPTGEPLLRVEHLRKVYPGGGPSGRGAGGPGRGVHALAGVSLEAARARTLAIVGESGCGKSTLARIVTGLEEAGAGTLRLLTGGVARELARTLVEQRPPAVKRAVQMVFQHPDDTLNPSHTVGFALGRALRRLGGTPRTGLRAAVAALLERVHLPPALAGRLPRQLSGGQKQRVAIARALAGDPALLVADEPVSALDVSVQAAILNLLLELQAARGMTLLFISHDLAVVRYLADDVAVLYLGQVMEAGPVAAVFAPPHHPYTEALLSAAAPGDPHARGTPIVLEGALPDPTRPPAGCPFHTRCPRKVGPVCEADPPPVHRLPGGHRIACHIATDELLAVQQGAPPAGRQEGD
jgi:peptide/nickel transport system ATP-binding protein